MAGDAPLREAGEPPAPARQRGFPWWLVFGLPFGVTTWVMFLVLAVRDRRRSLYAWSAAYGVAVVAGFAMLSNGNGNSSSAVNAVGFGVYMLAWLGGLVHGIVLTVRRRQLLAPALTPTFPVGGLPPVAAPSTPTRPAGPRRAAAPPPGELAHWRHIRDQRWTRVAATSGVVAVAVGAERVAQAQQGAHHPFSVPQFLAGTGAVIAGVVLLYSFALLSQPAEVAIGPGWIARRLVARRRFTILYAPVSLSAKGKSGALRAASAQGELILRAPTVDRSVAGALLDQFSPWSTDEARALLADRAADSSFTVHPAPTAAPGAGPDGFPTPFEPAQADGPAPVAALPVAAAGPDSHRPDSGRPGSGRPGSQRSDGRRQRFFPIGYERAWFGLSAIWLGGLIGVLSGLLPRNGTVPLVTGLVLVAVGATIALRMLPLMARPVVLDQRSLRVPAGRRGTTSVGLGEVAWVGMVLPPGGTRWVLGVGRTSAGLVASGVFTLAGTSHTVLGRTRAGRRAAELQRAVAERQGPLGPLTRRPAGPAAGATAGLTVWDAATARTRYGTPQPPTG